MEVWQAVRVPVEFSQSGQTLKIVLKRVNKTHMRAQSVHCVGDEMESSQNGYNVRVQSTEKKEKCFQLLADQSAEIRREKARNKHGKFTCVF